MTSICSAKHTSYQPSDEDWKCPDCGEGNEKFYVEEPAEGVDESCALLHDKDEVRCFNCSGQFTGKQVAKKIKEKSTRVLCPLCLGKKTIVPASADNRISEFMQFPSWVFIDAARYAMGRRSYQVGVTCEWLVNNWGKVPLHARQVIARDLGAEIKRDNAARANNNPFKPLGDNSDRDYWMLVWEVCKNEASPDEEP